MWCLPGGKVEKDETRLRGVLREVREEVGVALHEHEVKYIGKLQIRRLLIDYNFHIYHAQLQEMPILNLCEEECTEARWVTIEEMRELPLIASGKDVLASYEKIKNYS